MKQVWTFYRRSTDRQEVSIEDQRAACRAKAADMGCVIAREFVPAKGYASGLTIEQDATFQEMVRVAEAGGHGISALIIYSVSRFGRVSPELKIYWEQRFKKQGGIQIVYVKDDFKNDGSIEDVLLKAIKHSEAHQYSLRLSEDTLRGAKTHAARGKSCGGRAPYGYDRQLVDVNGNPVKRLGPGEHKADKLQRIVWVPGDPLKVKTLFSIFKMADEGVGLRSIADRLNSEGVPGPTGRSWSKLEIHYIIRNVSYLGTRVYNKRGFHDRSGATKRGALKPESEWVTCENAHEPIVPRDLFDRVQSKLRARRFSFGAANRRKPWLLSGLLTCQDCGHRFQGITKQGKGRSTEYYTCGGYVMKGAQVCRSIHIPRETLEGFILDSIRTRISDPKWMGGLKERLQKRIEFEFGHRQGPTVADVQQAMAKNQKQVDNLLDALKSGIVSAFVRNELERLEGERGELMKELESLRRKEGADLALDGLFEEVLGLLENFDEVIRNGDPERRKLFLRSFLYGSQISHAKRPVQATHYFFKVPLSQKETAEGGGIVPRAFGDSYLTRPVAGAGFEPATSRL